MALNAPLEAKTRDTVGGHQAGIGAVLVVHQLVNLFLRKMFLRVDQLTRLAIAP